MAIKVNAFSPVENKRLSVLLKGLEQAIDHIKRYHDIINVRHFVIDEGVKVEGFVPEILGYLIGIQEISKSMSFGYQSSSLSFSIKFQLIQDVLSKDKRRTEVIKLFSQIRNKFAHVELIANMDDLRAFNENIGKDFDKLYPNESNSLVQLRLLVKEMYTLLLQMMVNDVSLKAKIQRGIDRSNYARVEMAKMIKELPNSQEFFSIYIERYNGYDKTQPDEIEFFE